MKQHRRERLARAINTADSQTESAPPSKPKSMRAGKAWQKKKAAPPKKRGR